MTDTRLTLLVDEQAVDRLTAAADRAGWDRLKYMAAVLEHAAQQLPPPPAPEPRRRMSQSEIREHYRRERGSSPYTEALPVQRGDDPRGP